MRHPRVHSILLGLVIAALGVVWLLRNLGIIDADIGGLIATCWPILLVIWGIDALSSALSPPAGDGSRPQGILSGSGVLGIILIALGVLIIGRNMGFYYIDFSMVWKVLWPLVIILIGWSLIRGASGSGGTHWAVMSGIERKSPGWSLQDGNYIAFMGGADLDLTVANIPDGTTSLNLTAVMGGVDLRVPPDIAVECQGTAILGGVKFLDEEGGGIVVSRSFARPGAEGSRRKLVIHAWTLMGGIEVKQA